jgi:hypothetical protein
MAIQDRAGYARAWKRLSEDAASGEESIEDIERNG